MSVEKAISAIPRIIPIFVLIALAIGCEANDLPQNQTVQVAQRRAAISGANEHLNAGRIPEALAITTTLVERDSQSAEAQEIHALVLLAEAGRLELDNEHSAANQHRRTALHAYESACAHSTTPGLLQLSTAQLAQMLDEDILAVRYYKQAHINVPNDGRAAFFLTQIYLLQEDWQEANHWIDESLARDPNEPYALLSSGLIEAELGHKEEAIQLAAQGCRVSPDDANLRFIQARIMRLVEKPKRALEILSALPLGLQESSVVSNERKLCLLLLQGESQ